MKCRLCGNDSVELLIDFGEQPIVHNLLKSADEQYETYPFELGCCQSCGFLQVMRPIDPEILYQSYFTISSWKNQPHVPRLIEVMEGVGAMELDTKILDVGCNDGSFLEVLKKRGYQALYGIEPTQDAFDAAIARGLNVHHGFFGEDSARGLYGASYFDAVVTRQVLEHITDLDDFLSAIRLVLKDDGLLVIEIPNSDLLLRYLDYALWEEHVNYFTLSTLSDLLAKHSFAVTHYEVTLFSGSTLTVFCEKIKQNQHSPKQYVNRDCTGTQRYKAAWNTYIDQLKFFLEQQTRSIAIYGCGARSSTFINFTGIAEYVGCFIDDQPQKQDFLLPGAEIPIEPWSDEHTDDFYLLGVNTENESKVIRKRNLAPDQFCSVLPPSHFLPDFWKSMIYGESVSSVS